MATREREVGVVPSALLALAAVALAACGAVKRADGVTDDGVRGGAGSGGAVGSGGKGDSSGANGGTREGSSGVGGTAGGSAAIAGSSGDASTSGRSSAGDGGASSETSASFYWIEAAPEHRARAASSAKRPFLQVLIYPPYNASVLIGRSDLHIGEATDELYREAILWTEATGTIGLGGLPGVTPASFSSLSEPRAISADGSVVVGVASNAQRRLVPFRWTRADGMEPLAELGEAVAVSADGSIVAGVRVSPVYGVFRWTRALGAVTIVEPFAGDDTVRILAMSDDGTTVVGQSGRTDNTAERLFVWKEGVGPAVVENLTGQAWCLVDRVTFSHSHGFVAAGACYDGPKSEPFLWAGQDKLVALGPADALGGYLPGGPLAVTADGSVAVGGAGRGENESRIYRWTKANGLELIELPEGYTSSTLTVLPNATPMSEDGSVVVGNLAGTESRAFLWSSSDGAVVLSPLEGHTISTAAAVSADGSIVVGTSRYMKGFPTTVYWRADGVPHRMTDELAAGGIELGGGTFDDPRAAQIPLVFFGYGSKDEVSFELPWRARLR